MLTGQGQGLAGEEVGGGVDHLSGRVRACSFGLRGVAGEKEVEIDGQELPGVVPKIL